MWILNLDDPCKPLDFDCDLYSCGAVLQPSDMSTKQLVQFYHACLFSPAISTMLLAADLGYLDNFPGLTPEAIRKFPPNPIATPMGHLNQKRQGLRSTKLAPPVSQPIRDAPSSPPNLNSKSNNLNKLFHRIECKVVVVPSRQNFTDLTGRFPISSAAGTNYVLIMFCQDINYIHAEKLRSREAAVILDAYKAGVEFFEQRGVKPEFERLDNETSNIFQKWCRENQINVQFVPPGMHRANKSERHIQTWKNHFIAGLATADPDFPLVAWDELIEQAELSLNLLFKVA